VDPYFILEEVSSSPTPVVAGKCYPHSHKILSLPGKRHSYIAGLSVKVRRLFLAVVDSEGLKYQIPKTLREAKSVTTVAHVEAGLYR
jgi:hypothetical protein